MRQVCCRRWTAVAPRCGAQATLADVWDVEADRGPPWPHRQSDTRAARTTSGDSADGLQPSPPAVSCSCCSAASSRPVAASVCALVQWHSEAARQIPARGLMGGRRYRTPYSRVAETQVSTTRAAAASTARRRWWGGRTGRSRGRRTGGARAEVAGRQRRPTRSAGRGAEGSGGRSGEAVAMTATAVVGRRGRWWCGKGGCGHDGGSRGAEGRRAVGRRWWGVEDCGHDSRSAASSAG